MGRTAELNVLYTTAISNTSPSPISNPPHVSQQLNPLQNTQPHDPTSVGQSPHNFTAAPAPKQNQHMEELQSMLSKMTLSMAEMANAIKTQCS